MRKKPLVLAALLVVAAVSNTMFAQRDGQVLGFDNEVWDFGTIKEADGPVSHVFSFTNKSSRAVVIENVTRDCGCTTPKYSKEPIRPGGKGTIEVVFDPDGYWGEFSKTVSVFSNDGKSRNDLRVTGRVEQRERTVEELYPYTFPNGLRADNLRLAFDYVPVGSSKSMVVGLVNASDKDIRVMARLEHGSGCLKADVPHTLKPGERGTATLTYAITESNPVYGMITDRVRISANGASGDMGITTYAIGIDDFSAVNKESAPQAYIKPVFYNFGKAAPKTVLTKEVIISNTGTAPLIVRVVEPRAGCTCDLKPGTTLAPGKSAEFRVTMDTDRLAGVRTGGVTIIVNDPDRPMREIRLAVEVTK